MTTHGRLPDERREALRAERLAEASRFYNPWLHLAFPSAVGLGLIAASVSRLEDVTPAQLAFVPATLVFANAFEWRVHKSVLHRRTRLLELLYDRHTPQHHMIYVTEDMAIRSPKEFRLVLVPAFGVAGVFLVNLPLTAALWRWAHPNLALLYVASTMAYAVTYEWLHLSYHLPEDSFVGRLRLVRWLKRHHANHHDPERMQRYNMNVSVPLWDFVRGTIYREPDREEPPRRSDSPDRVRDGAEPRAAEASRRV